MRLMLDCPRCNDHFLMPLDSPAAAVLEQLTEAGPWCAVGDGETLEDQVFAALGTKEMMICPLCGTAVTLREENLGQFARALLTQW
jgi:hypothetical protein